MDILLVGTYTQHDAPAVLEKQELGKGIYLIPYNEILGDVAGTPLIIQMQNPSWVCLMKNRLFAVSESEDAADSSDTGDSAETTTVDKQLVIYVGDNADDGSRYVTIDNKQVYTMSTDTLSAIIDKKASDLWSLIVNYQSVKTLDQLQVTYGETTSTVNVSRETSTDDDGNEKETTTYQLNGKEIESTTFTTFYNKLINMAGQKRLTDAYTPAADPEMTAVFTDSDKNQTTVTFYTYDTNYYAAVVGDKVFLVNKMTVKEMFNAYETMVNGETETEATATPTAETEK